MTDYDRILIAKAQSLKVDVEDLKKVLAVKLVQGSIYRDGDLIKAVLELEATDLSTLS